MEVNATGTKLYWKSLKEYYDDPLNSNIKTNEFADGITDEFSLNGSSALSRRRFLALAAASAAFAATACTDYKDRGAIVPYNNKPENLLPGEANYYASVVNSQSVLVKTREGRPIRIDGNPEHPVLKGKVDNRTQAAIMNLYDPDRLKFPKKSNPNTKKAEKIYKTSGDWQYLDREIIDALSQAVASNKEIAIVSHSIHSPTLAKLLNEFINTYPTTKVYTYELFDVSNRAEAWFECYGNRNVPVIKWNDADIILTLDADILGSEGNVTEQTRLFTERRDIDLPEKFNRLYAAESSLTLTGLNSDYRLRLKPEKYSEFIFSLINDIISKTPSLADEIPAEALSRFNDNILNKFASENKLSYKILDFLVRDLVTANGRSIVYAGDTLPIDVHIAVNLLNHILGSTLIYSNMHHDQSGFSNSENRDITTLVNNLQNGSVGVVIHLGSNPVFLFPPDLKYKEALRNVDTIIAITDIENETSSLSHYVLPMHHDLESWGDYKDRTGLISLQQPVISPLYNTRQKEAMLMIWSNKSPELFTEDIYHKYLMKHWEGEIYPGLNLAVDFQHFWYSALHDGFVTFNESAQPAFNFNYNIIPKTKIKYPSSNFTLVLKNNYTIGDGRFANNGWLLELPHPVSKITWENYAAISPGTARALNLQSNDLIEIINGSNKITIPVFIQPGTADDVIAVELGYGRKIAGKIGSGNGFDAIGLMKSVSSISKWIYTGVKINKVTGSHKLASTQEHHDIDDSRLKDLHKKRDIIREGTIAEYLKNPSFLHKDYNELKSITPSVKYTGVKWGMSIDLNKCTGCGLCISACNVENNVAVVGKEQVLKGREMQWIRIDRYYSGTPDDPVASLQPMLCQHCDNAPCENVCPVNATNHSPDGLNQMAYNRCVGTRYCSNNCPFKVRRFNFFDYRDHLANGFYYKDSLKLMSNPEVTVRSRGVMEKCTFCIQRIMEARQEATKHGREINGRDVKTACQEACPAEAIRFGDINDPNSDVSRLRQHKLAYHVLEILNIKPNVTYIAKLRNIYSEEA